MIDVVDARMRSQGLRGSRHSVPAGVVRQLGAVQAQDYPGAAWAVAQRTEGLTRADVDAALADGSIIRTHVLRPTWHLVVSEDVRWMLALTAPRVRAQMAPSNRGLGLDDEVFAGTNRAIAAALSSGQQLTRNEVGTALIAAGIDVTDSRRLSHVVMRAELDGVVCSAGLRGRQHTYALMDAWVAPSPPRSRDESLAALAERYITGHGPATERDFAWWAGLSLTDARAGLGTVRPGIRRISINGSWYWLKKPAGPHRRSPAVDAHLLPNYDEYTVAYVDRSHAIGAEDGRRLESRSDSIFTNVVLVQGRVVGTWRRALRVGEVRVAVKCLRVLRSAETDAVHAATVRFGRFLGVRTALDFQDAVSR